MLYHLKKVCSGVWPHCIFALTVHTNLKDARGRVGMFKRFIKKRQEEKQHATPDNGQSAGPYMFVSSLKENLKTVKDQLQNCADINYRYLEIAETKAYLVYSVDIIDKAMLNKNILEICFEDFQGNSPDLFEHLKNRGLAVGALEKTKDVDYSLELLFTGHVMLLLDGHREALLLNIKKLEIRGVDVPSTEPSILGPKESFGETLSLNASLLRRRLPVADFKMVELVLGQKTRTKLRVCYLANVASSKLVAEVLRRLELINIDGVLSEGMIGELIDDEPYSVFPTIIETERPDKAVASILEGRVVIIQDNTSFALILPAVAMQFLQAADDYYNRYYFVSFIRFARLAALFLSLYLPGLYVAVTTFHPEMLPTQFIISVQSQREGIPYPAIVEAIMMGFAFEILREAGLRLPRAVGQAISIVGALIIGESAVTAGLVSPAMVIVTAVTAISSFTFPSPALAGPVLIIRLLIVFFSGALGLWGILIISLLLIGHLASLRSFGMPYLAPLGPLVLEDLDDFLIRAPLWSMKTRPVFLSKKNPIRQSKKSVPQSK